MVRIKVWLRVLARQLSILIGNSRFDPEAESQLSHRFFFSLVGVLACYRPSSYDKEADEIRSQDN
jgi:hypothetical protein